MNILKIECPHCRQHFEIDEAERGENYQCSTCGDWFNGREAVVLSAPAWRRKVGSVLFVLALILLAANVSLLVMQRLPKPEPAGAVPAVDPAEFAELSSQVGKLEAKLAAVENGRGGGEAGVGETGGTAGRGERQRRRDPVDLHPARQA